MKKLLLALLLLPTPAFAQTQPLPCPGSVVLTYAGGYTVTVNCSTAGTTPPPPPPASGSTLPAGYAFIGGDSARMQVPSAGTLAFGNNSQGWTFRAVNGGDFVYCTKDNFPGAPSINNPTCYFKAG